MWPSARLQAVPPALWATVRVGVWASQRAWNLAAVSQPFHGSEPLQVEQHSDHSWPSVVPAQPLSVPPHSAVSSREPGKCGLVGAQP